MDSRHLRIRARLTLSYLMVVVLMLLGVGVGLWQFNTFEIKLSGCQKSTWKRWRPCAST
jgi:hypothetical protein